MSDGDDRPDADNDRRKRTPRGPSIHPDQRGHPPIGADRALAAIPPDTRTLTQRMLGDPIPNDPRRQQRKE